MPISPKKFSDLTEVDAIADGDYLGGIDVSASTPAAKNKIFSFTKIAAWILAKFSAPSQAEAEAGTATTARLWTAERVAQAIAALAEGQSLPDVISQAEAEAGTATTARLWTAERVAQAIAALAEGASLPDVISQAEAEAGTATTARLWTAERVAQAIAALAEGASLPDVVSQAEAEAGTATTARLWTAERVAQAIAALAEGGGASLPVADTTALVKDPVDATKLIRLDAGNVPTETTVVIQSPGVSAVVGLIVIERSVSGSPLNTGQQAGFVATRAGRVIGVAAWVNSSGGTYPVTLRPQKNGVDEGSGTFSLSATDVISFGKYGRVGVNIAFSAGDVIGWNIAGSGAEDVGGSGASGTPVDGTIIFQFEIVYNPA